MIQAGFAKTDITPRIGVELCGFGPYRLRRSIAVRDRLWARAMVLDQAGRRLALVTCDLVGLSAELTDRTRARIAAACNLPAEAVMLHGSHTHSGPNTVNLEGWGEPDVPYLEVLPGRIADAVIRATAALRPVRFSHAVSACPGIGLNREYDRDSPPLDTVLDTAWQPEKPELTDTACQVVRVDDDNGPCGFLSYFGCHPVVCCAETRSIHGDYPGIATNMLEREFPGTVGLFLLGAHGDVNSCVVHKPEMESLLALDVVAARYANAVRHGLQTAQPITIDGLQTVRQMRRFTRKPWGVDKLRELLTEQEAVLHADGASETDQAVRMAAVYAVSLRRMINDAQRGVRLDGEAEIQGLRIGPLRLLGSPFETFQAIKNDVNTRLDAGVIPLVMSLTNDCQGYAPDHAAAARGGYAADIVPLICGQLPHANLHDELADALLAVAQAL